MMRKSFLFIIIYLFSVCVFASEETKEIMITGIGTSIDDAVENGLNNAVNQAVGSILRSEITLSSTALIFNDNDVFEEAYYENIVLYSKGFIESYEVLNVINEEELWSVDLKVMVSYEPLKDYIINSDLAQLEIDGEMIARKIETNQQSDSDFQALLEQIISEMNFIRYALETLNLEFDVDSYSKKNVVLSVKATLAQREDYLEFIMNNFEDVFSVIEHDYLRNKVDVNQSMDSMVFYLSQITQFEGFTPAIHILSEVTEDFLILDSYYMNQEDQNSSIFKKMLSDFLSTQLITVSVIFQDEDGQIIYESEKKLSSETGVFLKSQAMGIGYTSQHGGQFFFCPAVISIQPGTMKLSFEPLNFSWKIKMETEDFLKIKSLKLRIN